MVSDGGWPWGRNTPGETPDTPPERTMREPISRPAEALTCGFTEAPATPRMIISNHLHMSPRQRTVTTTSSSYTVVVLHI